MENSLDCSGGLFFKISEAHSRVRLRLYCQLAFPTHSFIPRLNFSTTVLNKPDVNIDEVIYNFTASSFSNGEGVLARGQLFCDAAYRLRGKGEGQTSPVASVDNESNILLVIPRSVI